MLWTCKSRSPPWWKSSSPASTKIDLLICYLLLLYHWTFHTSATEVNWNSSLLSKGCSKKSLMLVTLSSRWHFCVKCWTTPCCHPLCTSSALWGSPGCLSSLLRLCLVWSPDPLTLCLITCAVLTCQSQLTWSIFPLFSLLSYAWHQCKVSGFEKLVFY